MGAVATTLIAGVEAVRKGLAKPIGSVTQMGTIRLGKRTDNRTPLLRDFVPLAALDDSDDTDGERVVHASADLDYLTDLVCEEEALAAGAAALRRGAPVVADSVMVSAGITSREVVCRVRDPRARSLAARAGITLHRTDAASGRADDGFQ